MNAKKRTCEIFVSGGGVCKFCKGQCAQIAAVWAVKVGEYEGVRTVNDAMEDYELCGSGANDP